MKTIIIAMILLGWTALSIWWFLANLGRKNEPDAWYDWIAAPPLLAITWIFGQIRR